MPGSNTADHTTDLDSEFRRILMMIKPHIGFIDNHYHLDRFRIWLERLSAPVDSRQKKVRNAYLRELANQIHNKVLKPPFIYNPPVGSLPKLKGFEAGDVRETPRPNSNRRSPTAVVPQISPSKKKLGKGSKPVRSVHKSDKVQSPKKSENSSWCDMSGDSSTNLTTYDTDVEEDKLKVTMLLNEGSLKVPLEKQSGDQGLVRQLLSTGTSSSDLLFSDPDRKPTDQEMEALKQRMKDLLEVKNALQATHCLTEDRKKIVDTLQQKLTTADQENNELKKELDTQKKRIKQLEDDIGEYKEKISNMRSKELQLLKQHHQDEMEAVEKAHANKLAELQLQIFHVTTEYEDKLKKMSELSLNLRKEKEEEISRLQQEVKSVSSVTDQSEQVVTLKRCLSKMDKLMHRNEKGYIRTIEKLRQDLEVKDMAAQVHLHAQKADLLLRNSASKQEELKLALDGLEAKYRKMIETLQAQSMEVKRQDKTVIEELRTILDENNIPY